VSELVRGQLRFGCCELLLLDTGSWALDRSGTQERERPPLEEATRQRLVKTMTENTSLCVIVIFKV
jgi:hypothetical protein